MCEALQLNSAPPAPHEYADKCVTSVPERLELYGAARPKPPTLRRRAPKNTKNPSGGWGKAFWPESGSLISVSKSKRPPPPVWRVPKIGKKRRFDAFFGRFFAFRLLREPCKNAENAVNTNTFWTRDAQNTANTSVFESAAKKHCKLQHFWRVDGKKCWYSQCFCNFKKTWKARNTVNSGVLATFGRQNAGIYAVFCPWRRQTPVNYSIFFPFWTDLLRWWTQKNAGIYAFFKKSKVVTWTKPCK